MIFFLDPSLRFSTLTLIIKLFDQLFCNLSSWSMLGKSIEPKYDMVSVLGWRHKQYIENKSKSYLELIAKCEKLCKNRGFPEG